MKLLYNSVCNCSATKYGMDGEALRKSSPLITHEVNELLVSPPLQHISIEDKFVISVTAKCETVFADYAMYACVCECLPRCARKPFRGEETYRQSRV